MASEAMNIKDSTLLPKKILLNANMTQGQKEQLFGQLLSNDQDLISNKYTKGKALEGSYGASPRTQLPESALSKDNPNNIKF